MCVIFCISFLQCRQHSQTEILSNFESYENWFEKSATAPEYPKNILQQQKQFNNKIDFDAVVKVSRESSNENPHFSLPETFHNALSFRNYDNHGFSSSITNLLDTFIVQSEHNNGHSHQRIPRGGHSESANPSPISQKGNPYHLLRKNMPRDFPMIVRQAIEKQEEENIRKLSIKGKIPRQNAVLYMSSSQDDRNTNNLQSLPPPPPPPPSHTEIETPSIESAPSSIDFTLAVNSNISNISNNETDNENNKVKTSDINLNFKTVDSNIENGAAICKSRNSHQRNSESSGFSSIDDFDDENTDNATDFDAERDTETFFNNINAMQLDDYEDNDEAEHCLSKDYTDLDQSFNHLDLDDESDLNSNVDPIKTVKNNDEDDEEKVFKEFNSHQYWYISPDIPVDMDILLEPEEKRKYSKSDQ